MTTRLSSPVPIKLGPLEQASNGHAVGDCEALPMNAGFTSKAGGYPSIKNLNPAIKSAPSMSKMKIFSGSRSKIRFPIKEPKS
jgi:hypothetical protein